MEVTTVPHCSYHLSTVLYPTYLMYMVTKKLCVPFLLSCISEAILGYNLTEVPAMMSQITVGAIGGNSIKNQVN